MSGDRAYQFSVTNSMVQFLQSCVGIPVRINEDLSGRLVIVEQEEHKEKVGTQILSSFVTVLTIFADNGKLARIPITAVRSLVLEEPYHQAELIKRLKQKEEARKPRKHSPGILRSAYRLT